MKRRNFYSSSEKLIMADTGGMGIIGNNALMEEFTELPERPQHILSDDVEWIRDVDCTKDTSLLHGKKEDSIYGKGITIRPRLAGRLDTPHFKSVFLGELLPLEEYTKVIVLLSGGKDSIACYLRLRELGVPKEKIELWHHDIDGGHPSRRMDWRCTSNYVKAFAKAEGVTLRISYRQDGFFGELYRVGASKPVKWLDPTTNETKTCELSSKQIICEEIRKEMGEEAEELLKEYGYRHKFPAKTASLATRWCSSALKIDVASSVIAGLDALDELPSDEENFKKVLIVSGERRGESAGRSRYNEMEIHKTNADKKKHRVCHTWRAVIDYTEKDVWELLKRHKISPHPCYKAGWNRCSCMMCIFSSPRHFAGIKELFPEEYDNLRNDEETLGFTLDNNGNLDEFIKGAKSCVVKTDPAAIRSLITGEFSEEEIYVTHWEYPAGAFHGVDGGSC